MLKKFPLLALAATTSLLVGAAVFLAVRFLNHPRNRPAAAAPGLIAFEQREEVSLSMPTLDHRTWSLSDHAGRVVLVNYFATWCPPCRAELPDLKKIAGEFKDMDVALISVDRDKEGTRPREEMLNDFNDDERLGFPILLPPLTSDLFQMEFMIPQTLVVDRKGRVALHIMGPINPGTLRPRLVELMKESP